MKNWWVPGCTIGYEHTFINALADFLHWLETEASRSSPTSAPACGRKRFATRCSKRQERQVDRAVAQRGKSFYRRDR